jgi:hypothetical protein
MKKTLTLKSVSKITPTHVSPTPPIQGGKKSNKGQQKACTALLNQLNEMITCGTTVFIQMRHGTGYRGLPISLEDGWLTMSQVSIHGTKQTASTPTILIQIHDGSLIAHLHPVDLINSIGAK